MTRTFAIALALLGPAFTGCAMDASTDQTELFEQPSRGDSVERLEGYEGLVYERFEHADAVLEITALPDLDDPAFWDTVELLYFDGQDEHLMVTSLGPDVAASPELTAYLAQIDPAIVDQLAGIRRLDHTPSEVSAPAHAELLWALYDLIPSGQQDLEEVRMVVTIDDACVRRTGNYWECFRLVAR